MSIMSFPDRGHWGNNRWRGNLSGHVYKALYESLRPKSTVDVFSGSGTAVEVAKEMGIEAFGLDLCNGFNVLHDSVLLKIGKPVDLVTGHPPYGSMIVYSGAVWGTEPHPDDLSRCRTDDEFMEKLQLATLNMREATVPGGHYVIVIGDQRKAGHYRSFQAELIARMPLGELRSVCIKLQHNTVSVSRQYSRMAYPRIEHEYVIIWQRPSRAIALVGTLAELAARFQRQTRSTWANIVKLALLDCGGQSNLDHLYAKVGERAGEKTANNENWQAKVRQTLQINPAMFTNTARGEWALAA